MAELFQELQSLSMVGYLLLGFLIAGLIGAAIYYFNRPTKEEKHDKDELPNTDKSATPWTTTGQIDFAAPAWLEVEKTSDIPNDFLLTVEEKRNVTRLTDSVIPEIRWRKASLVEAKRILDLYRRSIAEHPEWIEPKVQVTKSE